MNCKHLRKISVIHESILTRQFGKSPNAPRQREFDSKVQISRGKLNLHKDAIQTKPLPSPEVWSRIGLSSDICKSPNFKFLTHKPSYKYDQRRNYSSLLEKIKNFIMSAFNNNSVPLLKAGEPKKDQANKPKASETSPTVTPSKSDSPRISLPSMLQWLKSKPKEKSEGQEPVELKSKGPETDTSKEQQPESLKKETKGGIATEPKPKDKKHDLVAESLMKETAQRLEVESKCKPPFETQKGQFAEDRISTEMPKKRREKIELEQEMKEERIEEAKDAEMYKVMDDVKHTPKKASATVKKLDVSKLCDHDDVFCGVEQYDDIQVGETQKPEDKAAQILVAKKTEKMKKKATQVFTCKGQVKPTGLVPKHKLGKGFEKNYSTSAITLGANRRTETPVFFTSKQSNGIGPKDFSARLLEVLAFKHFDKNFCFTASMFSKLKRQSSEDLHENIRNRNAKSSRMFTMDNDIAGRIPVIIQKDPLEICEQKEPKSAIEVKEPNTNPCELIEPINKESFKDPFLGIPLTAKGKKISYGRDAKEEDKKEDEKRKKERKEVCKEENRQMVIEEPCSQKKPLCCYNPPKRLLETDLTDKCNAKCAVAPQKPPPLIDCSLCRRYETLDDDVPKPKPMVCTVRKCSKPQQDCPPHEVSTCTKPPRRSELCGGTCSKMECDKAKAKAKNSSRTGSCAQQKCTQKTCPRKGKPKPVVCPSMPKACMSKPKEKQAAECKKKTCSTINAASKTEEAKKKQKEAEIKKEREKKCSPKKKKPHDTCKVLSECEKKKLKAEADKKKAEEDAKNSFDPKLHTDWKAMPVKGSGRWCDKEGAKKERAEPTSRTVTPNMEKKYQSPRYEKKPVCENEPSTTKNESKGSKKCAPIGIIDVSQSLGTIENSLYLNSVLLESDDGNEDEGNKKGPAIPPPKLVEKSKSDSKIL